MGPPDLRKRFEEIYDANYPDLMTYVWRRTQSPDDAADAIAETFMTAWRRVTEIPEGREARLTTAEITRVLGCSRNAARIRAHRARRRLARNLRIVGADFAGYDTRAVGAVEGMS
ncbi:hypothetical protein JOL79_14045 [Microbispora sp. RL4-1S]|uniref:RNA polymerase sigma-70 region 2 domain-containing protein n=1 Tax=Microbispora oryzae TaxID=2806554 RepID=A0A941AK79_9ACTN|nr:sigma factor [Microbispora oryzae]MBP2704938.1 hypothetical protein [Microbispora oryzae]